MDARPRSWQAATGQPQAPGHDPDAPPRGGGSDEAGGWTADDEARSAVANRGLAADKYVRGSCLGQGSWAVVYKVRRVADGRVLAGKTSWEEAQLRRDLAVLRVLHHDHVLKLMDWHEEAAAGDARATLLVTELCAHGTLQARIDRAWPSMGRGETTSAVRQLGSALAYLHAQGLWHTDVKPRNVLVRGVRPLDVVLADCGDARRVAGLGGGGGGSDGAERGQRGAQPPLRGTPAYYSPETWQHGQHQGPADDVWALGVTLLGMTAQWPTIRDGNDDDGDGDDDDGEGTGPRRQRRRRRARDEAARRAREEVRRYARRCWAHARELRRLNPGDGLVQLAAAMLAWESGERASAAECEAEAARLLLLRRRGAAGGDDDDGDDGAGLGIEAPAGFRRVTFW